MGCCVLLNRRCDIFSEPRKDGSDRSEWIPKECVNSVHNIVCFKVKKRNAMGKQHEKEKNQPKKSFACCSSLHQDMNMKLKQN